MGDLRNLPLIFFTLCLSALGPAWGRAQTLPARQADTPTEARQAAFYRKSLIDGYETIGSRDPKWDADARRVLQLVVERETLAWSDPDLNWQIMVIGDNAARAGCDDPAVLYYLLRVHMSLETGVWRPVVDRLYSKLFTCKYPPFLKVFGCVRLMEFTKDLPQPDPMHRLLDCVYENLPGMLAEPDYPQTVTAQVCSDLTSFLAKLDGNRKPIIDILHGIMVKAQPNSPIPDLYLGLAYWRYSWDIPGVGEPETEGSKRSTRHRIAREALSRALAKDPHLAYASATMIGVMVDGGSTGPDIEKYFQRAIDDDPDCYNAYQFKMGSLNTGGPAAEARLLKFGHDCLATKRWKSRIPFLLLRAHRSIAGGNGLADFYKATPEAWNDVQALYEGYFAYKPKAITERIDYATKALEVGRPEIARKQIEDLKALAADPVLRIIIAEQEKPVVAALKNQ
ncbi:MAG: hypothetical protein JWP03_66 [Phycisphaerales bacterium]|jgi:hypothetical protein|nr:hypothetical protein [Phycisphaerales bacterium]